MENTQICHPDCLSNDQLLEKIGQLQTENTKLRMFIRAQGLDIPPSLTSPEQEAQDFLETADIGDLNLSTRAYNALVHKGIETIEDLVEYKFTELYEFRDFGKSCAIEVMRELKKHGIIMAAETNGRDRKRVEQLYQQV